MTSKYKLNPFNDWIKEALITQEMKGMMEITEKTKKEKLQLKYITEL